MRHHFPLSLAILISTTRNTPVYYLGSHEAEES